MYKVNSPNHRVNLTRRGLVNPTLSRGWQVTQNVEPVEKGKNIDKIRAFLADLL